MSGRQTRSFRYGPRLKITAPLAVVFLAAAAEMWLLAMAASHAWQVVFIAAGALTSLLAIAMIREAVVRLRGRRRRASSWSPATAAGGATSRSRCATSARWS
jgi:hypothetical protein